MSRVAVTSTVRQAGRAEFSGYVRIVDLDTGDVLHTEPVPESPWRPADPNPRGGTRGARGISAIGDHFVVANADTVFVFDQSWVPQTHLTHPLAGAIHDVLAEDDGVWLACANSDLLLKLGWDGTVLKTWCWRDDSALVRDLGFRAVPALSPGLDHRDPRVLQGGVHNIIHLNAVTRAPQGLLLSFGRVLSQREVRMRTLKARVGSLASRLGVVKPAPTKLRSIPASTVPGSSFAVVLLLDDGAAELLLRVAGTSVPNHNVIWDCGIVYGDSNGGRLVAYDLETNAERASVTVPGEPSFVRGLAQLDSGVYLAGSQSPFAIHAIDLDRGALLSTYLLGGDENESVYAICTLPAALDEIPSCIFGGSKPAMVPGARR